MKKTTYWALACTLLLVVGGLYYFNREEAPPVQSAQEANTDSAANIIFSGTSIIEQENGKKIWELTAETVQIDPVTKKAQLLNFKGTLYREQGDTVVVVARQAEFDSQTRDITLEGDIKATASDGAVFTAPHARWEAKGRMFTGSGGIMLTRDDTVITGDRIETDANMEKTKVQGNAHIVKGGTLR